MQTQRKAVSMELTHRTLRPKFDDSSLKKKNVYQSKMFVLSREWGKICNGFDAPYTGHHLSGCGFSNCSRRGGATIPLLSVLSPHTPSFPSTSIPQLDYQFNQLKRTSFFFLLTVHSCKDKHWHKKRQ